ncbi:MAG: hypothetical protein LC674_03235, partial [Actinobacteria bacterium]|nr:hypothetical protein [Actinomycetota bacterium]
LTHLTQKARQGRAYSCWSRVESIMNRDLLELYSDYLLSAFSYTTPTGLSAMTNGAISHEKITRFLGEKGLDSSTLWRLVKPLVRELEGEEQDNVL